MDIDVGCSEGAGYHAGVHGGDDIWLGVCISPAVDGPADGRAGWDGSSAGVLGGEDIGADDGPACGDGVIGAGGGTGGCSIVAGSGKALDASVCEL